MRTITATEKYRAVTEGKLAKSEFVRQMRQQYPMHITPHNGYDDTVLILKNRGLIAELAEPVKKVEPATIKFEDTVSPDVVKKGIRVELSEAGFEILHDPKLTLQDWQKAKEKALSNLQKDPNFYEHKLANLKLKKEKSTKVSNVDKSNVLQKVNEAKSQYKAVLNKTTKKYDIYSGKDVITSDLTEEQAKDKLKLLTKKGIVKEDHSSNPNDKYIVKKCKDSKEPWAVWEGEVRVKGFKTREEAKNYADKQNKKQNLSESAAELYFEEKRNKIKAANTVEEVLDVVAGDTLGNKEKYKASLKKFVNQKFKGKLEQAKAYFIKQLNEYEDNYFTREEDIEETSDTEQVFEATKLIKGNKYQYKKGGTILTYEGGNIFSYKSKKDGGKITSSIKPEYMSKMFPAETTVTEKKVIKPKMESTEILKESIVGIIKEVLSNKVITEAAASNLEKYINYENSKNEDLASRVRKAAQQLTDYIAKVEKDYLDIRDNIKDAFELVGPYMAPTLAQAFKDDVKPVLSKFFSIEVPKTKKVSDEELAELEAAQELENNDIIT